MVWRKRGNASGETESSKRESSAKVTLPGSGEVTSIRVPDSHLAGP